jgi:hypothetical protein
MAGAFLMLGEIRAIFMPVGRRCFRWRTESKVLTIEIGGDTTKFEGVFNNIANILSTVTGIITGILGKR